MSKNLALSLRENIYSVYIAQVFSLIMNFIAISLAARYLGVSDFGKFNTILAFVGIAAKLIDFGYNPILFRELTKSRNYNALFGTALLLRIIGYLFIFAAFHLFAIITDAGMTTILLTDVLLLNILLSNKYTNFRELFTIPYKINFKMKVAMSLVILDNLLLLGLVLLLPLFQMKLSAFIIFYVLSSLPGAAILYYITIKKYKLKIIININQIKLLLTQSYTIGIYVVLAFLFAQTEIILLSFFIDSTSVGLYSAALRLTLPLKVIPTAITVTIFPILINNISNNNNNTNYINFILKALLVVVTILAISTTFKAESIIALVFGQEYSGANFVLILLMWSLVFDFFALFLVDVLIAYNHQKETMLYILYTLTVSIILNVILIPIFSENGAVIARFIAGLGGTIILFNFCKKMEINFNLLNKKYFIFFVTGTLIAIPISFLHLVGYFMLLLIILFIIIVKLKYFTPLEVHLLNKLFDGVPYMKNIIKYL